jgi:hypothetical protein
MGDWRQWRIGVTKALSSDHFVGANEKSGGIASAAPFGNVLA